MTGRTARVTFIGPTKLVASCCSTCSGDISSKYPLNDAPALLTADVGIAIGAGTDVAVESAGIVLVRSDPRDVAAAIELSRATYAKMIQNLVWATGYNVIAIPIAAGVLVPWGIYLPMAVGAIAMSASTIIVAANAQLLRRLHLRETPITGVAATSAA